MEWITYPSVPCGTMWPGHDWILILADKKGICDSSSHPIPSPPLTPHIYRSFFMLFLSFRKVQYWPQNGLGSQAQSNRFISPGCKLPPWKQLCLSKPWNSPRTVFYYLGTSVVWGNFFLFFYKLSVTYNLQIIYNCYTVHWNIYTQTF